MTNQPNQTDARQALLQRLIFPKQVVDKYDGQYGLSFNADELAILIAALQVTVPVTEGGIDLYIVPAKATAENGLKARMIGEYYAERETRSGRIEKIAIDWTTIKQIYSDAVSFVGRPYTAQQPPADASPCACGAVGREFCWCQKGIAKEPVGE